MVSIPSETLKLVNDPKSVKMVATKSAKGEIHAIPVGSVMAPDANTIVFGAIMMNRASKNLESMRSSSDVASVVVCNGLQSCEIRAKVKDFQTAGPMVDGMNAELAKLHLKARGVWVLEPIEVWNQSAGPDAGKKIA